MNQQEMDEAKCREFVEEMNRLAEHERYRYLGHLSELERKHFSERLIKDRRTSRELHVACTRFVPDWTMVERANLQLLERRFASDLRQPGYEKYEITLQMRDQRAHPLQKLNRSGVDELARNLKQFLIDRESQIGEKSLAKFQIDDSRLYGPLSSIFRSLVVSQADSSTEVRVGVMAFDQSELEQRLDQAIASKLSGRGDILLVYSEGPLFLFDVANTVARLKQITETRQAQKSYAEIWFLAHYWTGGQKLYRVV